MNLVAIAAARRQLEQLDRCNEPDPDEGEDACVCHVCAAPIVSRPVRLPHGGYAMRRPPKGTRLCPACIRNHWRNAPCVSCGGVTRTWNWSSKARKVGTRGMCPTCREDFHRGNSEAA